MVKSETWIEEPKTELLTCAVCHSRMGRGRAWRIRLWEGVNHVNGAPPVLSWDPKSGVEVVRYSAPGVDPAWREIIYHACSLVCAERGVQNIGPEVAHPHRG